MLLSMSHNGSSWRGYLSLVQAFALADFKLRFHGSVLGILWSVIKPLVIFGVVFIVIALFIQVEAENYALSLLLGIILWLFFAETTMFSIVSIEEKSALLKKVFFPRTIVVLSAAVTAALSFLFNSVVFAGLFLVSDLSITPIVLMLPVYFILLGAFSVGVGYVVSSLFPLFRDVRTLWEMCIQLGAWITPLVYSVSMIPEKYVSLVYLNPVARVIEYSRWALLESRLPSTSEIFVLCGMSIGSLALGYLVFSARSKRFAEEL